jgi:hypothetical protein
VKVRMKVELSGTWNGQSWPARGDVADVDDAIGARVCSAGLAEPVGDHKADVETTTKADTSEKRRSTRSAAKD